MLHSLQQVSKSKPRFLHPTLDTINVMKKTSTAKKFTVKQVNSYYITYWFSVSLGLSDQMHAITFQYCKRKEKAFPSVLRCRITLWRVASLRCSRNLKGSNTRFPPSEHHIRAHLFWKSSKCHFEIFSYINRTHRYITGIREKSALHYTNSRIL